VAAARVIWRATGDPGPILPALREVVRRVFTPAGDAAGLLAELGVGDDLRPELGEPLGAGPHRRDTSR
jgi:hypothetical protein